MFVEFDCAETWAKGKKCFIDPGVVAAVVDDCNIAGASRVERKGVEACDTVIGSAAEVVAKLAAIEVA